MNKPKYVSPLVYAGMNAAVVGKYDEYEIRKAWIDPIGYGYQAWLNNEFICYALDLESLIDLLSNMHIEEVIC